MCSGLINIKNIKIKDKEYDMKKMSYFRVLTDSILYSHSRIVVTVLIVITIKYINKMDKTTAQADIRENYSD